MSELGESIIKGMEEAFAFVQGENNGANVHIPEDINVKRIRAKMDMTQDTFAKYFGVSVRTIQDWEQGRRVPSGPAKTLLFVIDQEPEVVHKALTNHPS